MQDILLVVTWSDGRKEERIPLFGQTIRVGHDAYNDIVLPPEFKPHAAYHAAVVLQEGVCYIFDPEGVGAVFLNGKRLESAGIITPDIPAYIGSPTHGGLFLRLAIVDMQFTQVVKTRPDMGEAALVQFIESLPPPPDLPEHVTPYLLVGWSAEEYTLIELDQESVIVGRSPAANITVPPHLTFVSGLHFQIIHIDHHFYVQDKNSTNGTHLNRTLLASEELYQLADGDIISIQADTPNGLVWFVFHDPLNPLPGNIARQDDAQENKSLRLWERIWHSLSGR